MKEETINAIIGIVVVIACLVLAVIGITKDIIPAWEKAKAKSESSVGHHDEGPVGPWGSDRHQWDTPRPR
jgi:hypothetical protein